MKRIVWAVACCLAVAVAAARLTDAGRGEGPGEKGPAIDQAQYAGSGACAECHKALYESWKDTAHNKMVRPPRADGADRTVLADFSQDSPDRPFALKDVKWVIGHRWK